MGGGQSDPGRKAHDAVVVGAGPNGLVAANHLADAGWRVLVLEAQGVPGGAVRSDADVHPGFVHDTFSSFYPLAVASPAIADLGLERFGLAWSRAPAVVGTPFRDGGWALLYAGPAETAAGLERDCPGDGERWMRLWAGWDRVGDEAIQALLGPWPPVRAAARLLGRLPGPGAGQVAAASVLPLTRWAGGFRGRAARMLLAGNAAHGDIPLDRPGSAAFALLLAMLGQQHGWPVPVGGSSALTGALVARLEAAGGEVRTGAPVEQILVEGGRATGVRLEGGEEVRAGRAVLADVAAPALYGRLLDGHTPDTARRRMRRFRWDPGTVKVDWALSGTVPWAGAPEVAPGTVHVGGSVEEIRRAGRTIEDGYVPAKPFLLAGQMAVADPGRAPAGGESLWAYAHVPQRTRGDAGPDGIRGTWDERDRERFADRMQARLEDLAPGLGDRVLARRVLGPRELEARDENLVGGALNGGTARLSRQLVLRPAPGLAGPGTPVEGLYLASSSAHPGGGVHGACGANAARAALAHRP